MFLLQAVLIFSFVRYERAKYGEYVYPMWADFTGWVFVLAAVLPIFVVAALRLYHAKGPTFREVGTPGVTPAPRDTRSSATPRAPAHAHTKVTAHHIGFLSCKGV